MKNIQGPRLSETISAYSNEYTCQSCGKMADDNMGCTHWQEHDENDTPTPVTVCLCKDCSDRIIDPHPFLYRRLGYFEPFPGVMRDCIGCEFRKLNRCTHPSLRSNGGEGLEIRMPQPSVAFVDTATGGHKETLWRGHPTCTGREQANA